MLSVMLLLDLHLLPGFEIIWPMHFPEAEGRE
jgi:hypothetical protein